MRGEHADTGRCDYPVIRLGLAFILATIGLPSCGGADDPEHIYFELQRAVNDEAAAKRAQASPQNKDQWTVLYQNLAFVRTTISSNRDHADEAIRGLRIVSDSDKVHQLCDRLTARLHDDKAFDETTFVTKSEAALRSAGDAVLKAKTSKDLDGTLIELNKMQTVLSARVLLGHQETLFQLRSAMAFVATWQDYLADVNSGKIAAANTKLLALAQYDKYPVVPRSEIIARVQPTPSPSPSR